MRHLSKHFKKKEFECHCGCNEEFEMHPNLISVLEEVREHFKAPVKVTSGYRCKEHNDSIGSTDFSQHRRGTAADIQVTGYRPKQVADFIETLLEGKGGLGRYESFTHVDVRTKKARWTY